jgi:TonB family protein
MKRINLALSLIVFGCLTSGFVKAQVGKKGQPLPPSTSKSSPPAKTSKTGKQGSTKKSGANSAKSVEQTYWQSITESTDPEDFKSYLQKYPNGEFVELARNRISSLESAERERQADKARQQAEESKKAETALWESVKNSTKIEDLRSYLSRYPNGVFAEEAKNKIETFYGRVFSGKDMTTKARVTSRPKAQYTEEARKNQITGTVVLKLVLSANGEVTNVEVVRGLPYGLTERAIGAARGIKFEPAMKDGHPVSQWAQIEYNFNLY